MTNPARFYCAYLGVREQSPRNFENMLSIIDREPWKLYFAKRRFINLHSSGNQN